jgi:uncharacterized protein
MSTRASRNDCDHSVLSASYRHDRRNLLQILCVALITLSGCATSNDFQQGMDAFTRGDYATAMRTWRPLAEAGDPAAQTNIGYLYYEGKGVSQNLQEAIKWYKMAATKNYPDACFNLGVAYSEGQGVERDPAEALRWYQIAADAGYAPAQTMVGNIYFRGVDVPMDREKGFEWYLKAAEQDDVFAQFFVANLYETGQGVAEDLLQAYRWLTIAEGGDHPDAQKTARERKALFSGVMTPEQIAEAEKLAAEWIAKKR